MPEVRHPHAEPVDSTVDAPFDNRTPASRLVLARREHLEYLGDLVLELQDIAEGLGCATLAGLLAVAHKEALIQSRSV